MRRMRSSPNGRNFAVAWPFSCVTARIGCLRSHSQYRFLGVKTHYRLPRAQGFRMPAEWESHEATWIFLARTNEEDWPGPLRACFRGSMAKIVRKLLRRGTA